METENGKRGKMSACERNFQNKHMRYVTAAAETARISLAAAKHNTKKNFPDKTHWIQATV